jgi:sulfide:quinone oxidoreductase
MKNIVILGAGTAGTMVANRLNRLLDMDQWQITMVDQDPVHYYQPGYLFIPFGVYAKKDVVKPKSNFIPPQVKLIQSTIESIEPEVNRVRLSNPRTTQGNGDILQYDFLIIATGADIHPKETPGLAESEWGKSIHTFYSLDGALALAQKLRN